MVMLRQSSLRGVRVSTSATNPDTLADRRPIPTTTVPDSTILVVFSTNSTLSIPMNIPKSDPNIIIHMRWNPVFALLPYFLTTWILGSSISEIFDGMNYNTWILAITIALDVKNKFSFVDGSLRRPSNIYPHYRI